MKRITLAVTVFILVFTLCARGGGAEPGQDGRGDLIESDQDGLAYYNGFDFGPNLGYSEEYANEGDPGDCLSAAEAAKLTFDTMKSNGNIPDYSDGTEYFMTLTDLTDIGGEECYVYRLDVYESHEPNATLAAYAYACQSGNIYMRGRDGQWVRPEGNSRAGYFTLFADFSAGEAPRTNKIPFPPAGEMPASDSAIAFFLADSLSKWTGLDFTLNNVTFDGSGVTVDWAAGSTLIAGLDDREQKEEFHFFDAAGLNWFMMDSLALTLKYNLPIAAVYYCSDGSPIKFPNPGDMAAQGLPGLPVDQPYEGSAFFNAHADGRGDLIDDEGEIPGWWGEYKSDETSCSIGITNFNTNPEGVEYFLFTILRDGSPIDDGVAAVFSENRFTAEYAEISFTLSGDSNTVVISVPESSEWSYLTGSYERAGE